MSKPPRKKKKGSRTPATKKRRAASEPGGKPCIRRLPSKDDFPYEECDAIVRTLVEKQLTESRVLLEKRLTKFRVLLGSGERPTGIRNRKHLELQWQRFLHAEEAAAIAGRDPVGWVRTLRGVTPSQQKIRDELQPEERRSTRPVAAGELCRVCRCIPPRTTVPVPEEPAPPSARPA